MSLLDVAKEDPAFVSVLCPNVVDSINTGRWFCTEAGIAKGDSLIAFNGTAMNSWNEFLDQMEMLKVKAN